MRIGLRLFEPQKARPAALGGTRDSRRGFSILELIAVLCILAIVLALTGPAFRLYKEREEIREAAQHLAADLDHARQLARTQGVPTGLVVKSDTSYEIRQGSGANPRLVKYVDLRGDYPKARLFVGWWDTEGGHDTTLDDSLPSVNDVSMSGWSGGSSDVTTPTPGELPQDQNKLAMGSWSGGSSDCAYVFWPNGFVKTNNLPRYDNAFHIVVAAAFKSSPASPPSSVAMVPASDEVAVQPPTSYRKLSQLWTPAWCTVVTSGGQVSTESSVPHMVGVDIDPAGPWVTDPPVPAVPPAPPAPLPPVLVAGKPIVAIDSDVTNTVSVTDLIGFRVNLAATTPDDPLTYKWSASGGTVLGDGQYATTWQAPSTPGSCTISVTVTTDKGRSASGSITMDVKRRESILVCFNPPGESQPQVFSVRPDGSGERQLTRMTGGAARPSYSPDGSRIVFHSQSQIYVADADGGNVRKLAPSSSSQWAAVWSPDGTRIAYEQQPASGTPDILVAHPDGGPVINVTAGCKPPGKVVYGPTWSPDSTLVYFHGDFAGGADICSARADGGGSYTNYTNASLEQNVRPAFAPGGQVLWWMKTVQGGSTFTPGVYLMNPGGGGVASVLLGTDYSTPAWGPPQEGGTANQIVVVKSGQLQVGLPGGLTTVPLAGGPVTIGNAPWVVLPARPLTPQPARGTDPLPPE